MFFYSFLPICQLKRQAIIGMVQVLVDGAGNVKKFQFYIDA